MARSNSAECGAPHSAEFERNRIGERIRATKQAQKARGEFLGGKPRFGWRHGEGHELLPDPTQQAALTRMRSMRAEGVALRTIADMLKAEGIAISHEGVKKVLAAADRDAA
jgi:DNA invertase Pin-like site-specific DNA recombinase